MGIVLRCLLLVNAGVLLASLARFGIGIAGLQAFADAAALVELSAMLSLVALCGLRAAASRWTAPLQSVLCALVPAILTAAVDRFLALVSGMPGEGGWVPALVAAAIAAFLQHYFLLRERAQSPALAEARLQALQARIRPHFLFNSLNAVLSLIRSQPRHAEEALEDLSDLLRVALRDARQLSTLDEELKVCRQYLAIETLRLGERLQVDWDTHEIDAETLRSARVPALLLQPLLENAVHHGVEPSQVAVLVKVALKRLVDRIEITVTNPLQAVREAGGHQMALSNIRERLSLLYDVEGELATSEEGGQFRVRLRFPYQRAST